MKRITALLLAVLLLCGAVHALADIPLTLLTGRIVTPAEVVATQDTRVVYGASVLLDYAMSGVTMQSSIAMEGTSYMASAAGGVEIFFLCMDGSYLHLFYVPSTAEEAGHLSDMGYTPAQPASGVLSYIPVDNGDIFAVATVIVNQLD